MKLQNLYESEELRKGGAYTISLHMRCDGEQLANECDKFDVECVHNDGNYYNYLFFSKSFKNLDDLMNHLVAEQFKAYSDKWRTFPAILKEEKIHYELAAESISNSDLDQLPSEIECDLWLVSDNFKENALDNFHKKVKRINGNFKTFKRRYSGGNNRQVFNVLGFLLIKELKHIEISASFDDPLHKVLRVVNKYLPGGDILDCQDELIDAGLEEYAKL